MKEKQQIQKLFWYFVLFSIIGLIIETLFCFITTGKIESRKGLIWGPFCPVYGVGAVILIFALSNVKNKSCVKLFIYGFLLGAIVEYLLSYMLEAIYGIRFWDYSYTGKDINGRICVLYSLFWGVLAVLLMKFIKPFIDKIIERITNKIKLPVEITLFVFLLIDALATVWGIHTYETRAIETYYALKNQDEAITTNAQSVNGKDITENLNSEEIDTDENDSNFFVNLKSKIENEYFTNERMKSTFPNLRTKDREGNELWIRDII